MGTRTEQTDGVRESRTLTAVGGGRHTPHAARHTPATAGGVWEQSETSGATRGRVMSLSLSVLQAGGEPSGEPGPLLTATQALCLVPAAEGGLTRGPYPWEQSQWGAQGEAMRGLPVLPLSGRRGE